MKRKIAILLAAVMTTAMLPMNVMADSTNSVDRIDTVKDDEVIRNVNLKISPKAAIESGASIIIDIENAEFDTDKIIDTLADDGVLDSKVKNYTTAEKKAAYLDYVAYTSGAKDYQTVIEEIAARTAGASANQVDKRIQDVLYSAMGVNTNEIPYEIKLVNDTEIEVKLAPLPANAADEANVVSTGKPYYLIPIVAIATSDEDDIKITIDDNGTSVSSTTHTVARTSSTDGATTTTVSKIKTGYDYVDVDNITVKETVKGTFENGTVKVRVNGGFEIVDNRSKKDDNGDYVFKIVNGINLEEYEIHGDDIKIADNGSYFTFELPKEWTNTQKISSFIIEGLRIQPEDDDKNWGDVNITISGGDANITKETIKVGERVDYGFSMEVKDEVPTIISGRTHLANDDLDEDDFKSAKVEFKETSKDTWITTRKVEFTVPEGVKIVDVEYDKIKRVNGLEDATSVSGHGSVLKINKGLEANYTSSKDEGISFEMNLYLSIDADFTGDVTLAVAGGGLAADTLEDVTIAQAVAPITVDTAATKVNMGYQIFDAADITITEVQDGVLLDGEYVIVGFDDKKFGNSELGFNDKDVEYSIDGELEIKDFKVNGGDIEFKVDKTSYSEPSSIKISNITVGTTRSVPYGSYDLKISGDAVVNNYKDDIKDVYDLKYADFDSTSKDFEDKAYFDTTDGYSFDDYVSIITDTNTLDGVVEVTIGEKTINVNGESVDMDVAAYIQTSSNSTMVPLRFVSLALGVDSEKVTDADNTSKIAWDANSKTATILYAAGNGQKIIQFQAGSNIMVVDGTSIPMEYGVTAEITDDRMFVPFRALGQALGVPVDWDAETRTAIYNKR